MEGRLRVCRVCPACQGAWFLKAGFGRYEVWQKLHLAAASAHNMSLLVCLCGRPQLPNLSGVRAPECKGFVPDGIDQLAGAHKTFRLLIWMGVDRCFRFDGSCSPGSGGR